MSEEARWKRRDLKRTAVVEVDLRIRCTIEISEATELGMIAHLAESSASMLVREKLDAEPETANCRSIQVAIGEPFDV